MALPIADFFTNAQNFEKQTSPLDVGAATSTQPVESPVPYPSPEVPTPEAPPLPQMPDIQSPGFGPIVPDTTTGEVTAEDSPGALFTPENMSAERVSGFLQQYADLAPDVDARETVAGQLTALLNTENPLFDWARGQAAQYANSRGLINSDIAAEAASQAVIGTALPIAQQDAALWAQRMDRERQFYYTAGLQAFDATIQSTLMAQDHLQRMVQMSHQGDINSRLQLEQFGYNWQLNEQQNLHAKQLAALQGDIAARLALQQFGFNVELMKQDYGYRIKLADLELRNALSLSRQDHEQLLERLAQQHANTLSQIDAQSQARMDEIMAQGDIERGLQEDTYRRNLQQNYLVSVERITSEFAAAVNSIWATPGLTSQQQQYAVNNLRRDMENQLALIAAQYQSSPYWDPSWQIFAASVPTPGPGTPGEPGSPYQPPYDQPPPIPNEDDVRDIIDALPINPPGDFFEPEPYSPYQPYYPSPGEPFTPPGSTPPAEDEGGAVGEPYTPQPYSPPVPGQPTPYRSLAEQDYTLNYSDLERLIR